jgi:hypothetical protein
MTRQIFDPDIAREIVNIIPQQIHAVIIAEYATDSWPDSAYVMLAQHSQLDKTYRLPLVEFLATISTEKVIDMRDRWMAQDARRILAIIKNTSTDTTISNGLESKQLPSKMRRMYFRMECPTMRRIQNRLIEFTDDMCHNIYCEQLAQDYHPDTYHEDLDMSAVGE